MFPMFLDLGVTNDRTHVLLPTDGIKFLLIGTLFLFERKDKPRNDDDLNIQVEIKVIS